jgi:spore coat protein U-like protein
MKLNKLIALPILTAALAFANSQAHAANTASTTVKLEMADYASVSATGDVTIKPTLAQIDAGTIDTTTDTDANGLGVAQAPITLTVDSTHGAEITLDGNGGSLNDADLSLKVGSGSWIPASDNNATVLYSSSAAEKEDDVPVYVKIDNLGNYDVGEYTNTVTFTITAAEAEID